MTEAQIAIVRQIAEQRSRLLLDELRAVLGRDVLVIGMASGFVLAGTSDGEDAVIACMALGSGELRDDDGRIPTATMAAIYDDVGSVMTLTGQHLQGDSGKEQLS